MSVIARERARSVKLGPQKWTYDYLYVDFPERFGELEDARAFL